jgi:hypothetical protein
VLAKGDAFPIDAGASEALPTLGAIFLGLNLFPFLGKMPRGDEHFRHTEK